MEFVEKVCLATNEKINKKTVLIPLATALNIDNTVFKTRKQLIKEIQDKCPASFRCENANDFVTLNPIDSIPKDRLFIWYQNKKTFGADILSLKQYIDSGKTMNPWTVDFATGIDDAKDRESYLKKFDMSKQKGLIEKIKAKYTDIETSLPDIIEDNHNENNKSRFEIEKLGDEVDQYVTHLINCTEECNTGMYLYVLSDTLNACMEYFLLQNEMYVFSLLQQVFVQIELMKFTSCVIGLTTNEESKSNITLLMDLFRVFTSQKDLIYAEGIIKYFFIEFEESLKRFNLL